MVDFNVDNTKYLQYSIGKIIYFSFSDHFEIAKFGKSIDYDPIMRGKNKDQRNQLIISNPSKYSIQGLDIQQINNIADKLIQKETQDQKEVERIKDVSVFIHEFFTAQTENYYLEETVHEPIKSVKDLLDIFHPKNKPILWRILMTQAFLYQILLRISQYESQSTEESSSFQPFVFSFERLDWHKQEDNISYDEVFINPVSSVKEYLQINLPPSLYNEDNFIVPPEIEENFQIQNNSISQPQILNEDILKRSGPPI